MANGVSSLVAFEYNKCAFFVGARESFAMLQRIQHIQRHCALFVCFSCNVLPVWPHVFILGWDILYPLPQLAL